MVDVVFTNHGSGSRPGARYAPRTERRAAGLRPPARAKHGEDLVVDDRAWHLCPLRGGAASAFLRPRRSLAEVGRLQHGALTELVELEIVLAERPADSARGNLDPRLRNYHW